MLKRYFFLFALCVCISAKAQTKFEEDNHYTVVADNKTESPTVTEYFSLFCGHCFQFEPFIDTLASSLKAGTNFEKSHVSYLPRDNEEVQFGIVKAFVAMGDLGIQKQLSQQFFAAIHIKQMEFKTVDDIKEIFLLNDISTTQFDKAFNDPSVVKRAEDMMQIWQEKKINNVPTILVNGKYRINMGSLSTIDELVELTNLLLEKD